MSTPIYLTIQQCADLMLRDANARRAEKADTPHANWANVEAAGAYDNCARFVRERCVLRWMGELPSEPGHYWARLGGVLRPHVVEIRALTGGLHLWSNHDGWTPLGDYAGREWAGPVSLPEEPL